MGYPTKYRSPEEAGIARRTAIFSLIKELIEEGHPACLVGADAIQFAVVHCYRNMEPQLMANWTAHMAEWFRNEDIFQSEITRLVDNREFYSGLMQ